MTTLFELYLILKKICGVGLRTCLVILYGRVEPGERGAGGSEVGMRVEFQIPIGVALAVKLFIACSLLSIHFI